MNKSFHHLLMVNQIIMHKQLFARIADTGLSYGQPKVLEYLLEANGCTQREIADGCRIEPASVSSLMTKMEADGLIERRSEDGNRRSLHVYLTDKGRNAATCVERTFAVLEAQAFEGIAPEAVDSAKQVLFQVYENLTKGE